MLIRFRVSNFLSFRDEVELSMIAGPSLNLSNQILKTGRLGIELLRGAAVYGANASGKSNLIKAIRFASEFIINGVKRDEKIGVKPFKIDPAYQHKPTKFEFEFLVKEKAYLYGFEIQSDLILSEWLYELKKKTEQMLFERATHPDNKVKVDVGIKLETKSDQDFLIKFAEGTRNNQLFLAKCYEDQNIHYFDLIVEWFKNLEFVFPKSKYKKFPIDVVRENKILNEITHYLKQFDTGVCGFTAQKFNPFETLPKKMIEDLESIKPGDIIIISSSEGELFLVTNDKEDNKVSWLKIMFRHQVEGCEQEIEFEMNEESDGTLRLIDLIPLLLIENKTIFVDEIDRSIHPSLIYKFIELILTNNKSSQIIFTTHEDHLLDQNLLRRDEVWFVEKDKNGATSLYSLEEFAPRKDLDIQKGYLHGRFGAIPFLGDCNLLEEE